MLLGADIKAMHKCHCPNCVAHAMQELQEEAMVYELRMELNSAGLLIDEYGVKFRPNYETA